jgi:hypothetical protein
MVDKVALAHAFLLVFSPFPASFHQCSILTFILTLLTRGTNGQNIGTFKKAKLFRNSWSIGQKINFTWPLKELESLTLN